MTATAGERVWGGLTTTEREAQRREKFVDAGLEVFAATGWHGATVAGICREAKLSPRYFYEAFPSREALFLAVVDRIATEVAQVALAAVGTPDASPHERARDTLVALDAYAMADRRRVRVALVESHGTGELRAARAGLLDTLADLAARLMRAFNLDAEPERLIATARLLSGGLAELLARGEPLDVDHIAALYAAAAPVAARSRAGSGLGR